MLERATAIVKKVGIFGLVSHASRYLYYNLKTKWEFVYFYVDFNKLPRELIKRNNNIIIRIAKEEDINKILSDVSPYMTQTEKNDIDFIKKIGNSSFNCFIVEMNGLIVHYSLLFERAKKSPLMKTTINKSNITIEDAYLSTIYTVPSARGLWIVPDVLVYILNYLKKKKTRRLYAIVHKKTKGAAAYYKRLGFTRCN
jgi:ribosomal protein S18 acetylase RimI-like enzyme